MGHVGASSLNGPTRSTRGTVVEAPTFVVDCHWLRDGKQSLSLFLATQGTITREVHVEIPT